MRNAQKSKETYVSDWAETFIEIGKHIPTMLNKK
jgi:hypothetical protein